MGKCGIREKVMHGLSTLFFGVNVLKYKGMDGM
jgi:hypothetical protein